MEKITDVAALRRIIGEPKPIAYAKVQNKLTEQAIAFIRQSPFMMLSTANERGEPSVSPKGDGPGFVAVEDEHTLYIPERSGNKLVFGFQNLFQNPNVGLLFMVPGTDETLRVRGRAELVIDEALCKKFSARGNPALLITVIKVTEAYFHCAKAFLRSELWHPETWPKKIKVSFGKEMSCNTAMNEHEITSLDKNIDERYQDRSKL